MKLMKFHAVPAYQFHLFVSCPAQHFWSFCEHPSIHLQSITAALRELVLSALISAVKFLKSLIF